MLSYLQQNNIPTAVATTRHNAVDVQRRLGQLSSYFVTVVNGDDVENVKPAPDIVVEVGRRLGVEPRKLLVLEDSLPGVDAALAAGALSILIPDMGEAPENCRADLVYRDLKEVLQLISPSDVSRE